MTEPPSIDNFAISNRSFYGQEPSAYFRDRLDLLALRTTKRDELAELIGGGLELGSLRVSVATNVVDATPEEVQARTTQFLITESQVLMHHCAEALLRMFLGHAGRPQYPWLEITALTDFRLFRDHLDSLAAPSWPADLRDAAADVFLGGVPVTSTAEFDEALDIVIRVIRTLATRLNRDKTLYNAAKHGMTVLAGEGSISFVSEDGQPMIGTDGTQVMYLEKEKVSKTEARWHETTRWLNPHQAVWLTHLAIVEMEALWAVARHHYLDEPLERIPVVTKEAMEAATSGFPRPGPIHQWRRTVATERFD